MFQLKIRWLYHDVCRPNFKNIHFVKLMFNGKLLCHTWFVILKNSNIVQGLIFIQDVLKYETSSSEVKVQNYEEER